MRFAALLSLFLIPRYCWIEAAWTDITRTLTRDWFHRYELPPLLKDDWQVTVSPTLVESDLTEEVLG